MLVDFRTVDLIDRAHRDDPDFDAFVRVLMRMSQVVNIRLGQRNVRMHVIPVNAEPAVMKSKMTEEEAKKVVQLPGNVFTEHNRSDDFYP